MRQLVRHRTANINEYSGRYSVMSDEFYLPQGDYLAKQSTTNNQDYGVFALAFVGFNLIRPMMA